MKTVKIKNTVLGEGAPKIIAPIMAADENALLNEAEFFKNADFDILEWRMDYFSGATSSSLASTGAKLRQIFPLRPLLFTFRSKDQGGTRDISMPDYIAINKAVADSGCADIIDIELGKHSELIDYAARAGVKTIVSHHDFTKTPPKDEIIGYLRKMQDAGADIAKIAVMPQNSGDVLELLSAADEMREKYTDTPFIAIAMGELGLISRISGGIFGSCATFGTVRAASAPGQINTAELRAILSTIHE